MMLERHLMVEEIISPQILIFLASLVGEFVVLCSVCRR